MNMHFKYMNILLIKNHVVGSELKHVKLYIYTCLYFI